MADTSKHVTESVRGYPVSAQGSTGSTGNSRFLWCSASPDPALQVAGSVWTAHLMGPAQPRGMSTQTSPRAWGDPQAC